MSRAVLKPEIKLGADKKKLGILGGLFAVLVGVWYMNSSDTPSSAPTTPAATRPSPAAPAPVARPGAQNRAGARGAGSGRTVAVGKRGLQSNEFKPTLVFDDPIDPARVDPTLRLDVLSKLQALKMEGGARSVFDFGQAPAAANIQIAQVKRVLPKPNGVMTGPQPPPPPAPPPAAPPPPPIPLKFYGFTAQRQGVKRAFFLEGDDIFVAGEGDTIKNRYKIIRIGVNSAVVEDTTNKHQQTLPLTEEAQQS